MQPPENEEGLDLWIILGIVVVVLVVLLHVLYIVRCVSLHHELNRQFVVHQRK